MSDKEDLLKLKCPHCGADLDLPMLYGETSETGEIKTLCIFCDKEIPVELARRGFQKGHRELDDLPF